MLLIYYSAQSNGGSITYTTYLLLRYMMNQCEMMIQVIMGLACITHGSVTRHVLYFEIISFRSSSIILQPDLKIGVSDKLGQVSLKAIICFDLRSYAQEDWCLPNHLLPNTEKTWRNYFQALLTQSYSQSPADLFSPLKKPEPISFLRQV